GNLGPAHPAVVTSFLVLRGTLTAQPLDAAGQPVGAPLQIGPLQSYSGAGLAPPRVQPIPSEQIGQILAGLQPTGPKLGPDSTKNEVKSQQVQTAIAMLGALMGEQETFAQLLPSTLLLPSTFAGFTGLIN